MTEKLTPKQDTFCREYIIDLNGTQAAIRAGYSKRTAVVQGSRLLMNANVSERIQTLMAERAERAQRSADDVLRDIEKVKASCMQEVEDTELGAMVMVDPKAALKALELEGRHRKMFTDKIEHSGKIGLENLIAGDE